MHNSCTANSNEEIRRRDFAGNSVVDGKCIACPVYLHGIARLVLDTHRRLGDSCPCSVFVTELGGYVRFLADGFRLAAVFIS